MTDIPEHLLRRSKERRDALGGAAPAGDGEAGSASVPATTAESGAPTSAAPKAAPVAAAAAVEDKKLAEEAARYRADVARRNDALRRNRIPIWATPVLVAMPVWGFLYAGAFGSRAARRGPSDRPARAGRARLQGTGLRRLPWVGG